MVKKAIESIETFCERHMEVFKRKHNKLFYMPRNGNIEKNFEFDQGVSVLSLVCTCHAISALSKSKEKLQIVKQLGNYLLEGSIFKDQLKKIEDHHFKSYEIDKGKFFCEDECFERFKCKVSVTQFKNGNAKKDNPFFETESFERLPQALVLLALFNLLDRTDMNKRKIKKKIKQYMHLFSKRIIVISDRLYVKGYRGGDSEHALYNLYYAKLVLERFINNEYTRDFIDSSFFEKIMTQKIGLFSFIIGVIGYYFLQIIFGGTLVMSAIALTVSWILTCFLTSLISGVTEHKFKNWYSSWR